MMKVAVVIRILEGYNKPVVSAIITPDTVCDNEIMGNLEYKASEHIRDIKQDYPEFTDASWYVEIKEIDLW